MGLQRGSNIPHVWQCPGTEISGSGRQKAKKKLEFQTWPGTPQNTPERGSEGMMRELLISGSQVRALVRPPRLTRLIHRPPSARGFNGASGSPMNVARRRSPRARFQRVGPARVWAPSAPARVLAFSGWHSSGCSRPSRPEPLARPSLFLPPSQGSGCRADRRIGFSPIGGGEPIRPPIPGLIRHDPPRSGRGKPPSGRDPKCSGGGWLGPSVARSVSSAHPPLSGIVGIVPRQQNPTLAHGNAAGIAQRPRRLPEHPRAIVGLLRQ